MFNCHNLILLIVERIFVSFVFPQNLGLIGLIVLT